ncbi:hypothetical protein BT96DRAFT_1024904 [Gymnopus androsaceus JB14]|uniref:Mid2 domain-containing protein n=1 Tax=Gymnopus androsaceus JB14 TaxID=1447944 RepID=A0A6A4GVM7_9AGAR|nr:hypothetical protein BT96DRAFT_1024904 [Gymnopus androsaceus JB14]
MFLSAWLLYSVIISHNIYAALSLEITATTGADSPTVTGTWVLQPGDPPQASQGFIIQLLSDELSGEKSEDSSTVDPQQMSTGTVTLTATSTGAHRLQIILPPPTSSPSSSAEFTIVNLDAEGTETGKSSPASTSTSPASSSVPPKTEDSTVTSTSASELNPTTTGTSTFLSSGTTSESTQIHSTTSMPSSSESTSSSISTDTKKTNLTAIIVSAILATILSIILLLAVVVLLCRRRRRRLKSMVSSNPSEAVEPFREYTIGPGIPSHRRKDPGLSATSRPVPQSQEVVDLPPEYSSV